MCTHNPSARAGLARVEVIILSAIFAMATLLSLPAVLAMQRKDAAQQTLEKLKDLSEHAIATLAIYSGQLPPAYGQLGGKTGPLYYHLLLCAGEGDLYKKEAREGTVEAYLSSEDPSLENKKSMASFGANVRLFTKRGFETAYDKNIEPFKKKEDCAVGKLRYKDITDGAENTIMFTTKLAVCGEGGSKWPSSPVDKTAPFFGLNAATEKASATSAKGTFQLAPTAKECLCTPPMAQSFSRKGLAVGMADGATRIINAAISPETWNRAVQPNDGKELGKDWNE